jgi:hypothetical protein
MGLNHFLALRLEKIKNIYFNDFILTPQTINFLFL